MTVPTRPTRPTLKPALRRLRRAADAVQLGVGPDVAVVLSGLDAGQLRCLDLLDGRADDDYRDEAAALGIDVTTADELVTTLAAAGLLDDGPPAATVAPLAPDRLALSLRCRDADAVLARRRAATVDVYGAGRLGTTVATLLAAAGVGVIGCVDPRPLSAAELAAGVAGPLGIPAGDALAQRLRETTPVRRTTTSASDAADVSVLAPTSPVPVPEHAVAAASQPHLLVTTRETAAYVGPFVVPGATPCLRCVELARAERDPAWPLLAAQLANRGPTTANDIVLSTLAATRAVIDVLSYLDSGVLPATASAVVELSIDAPAGRRRSVTRHPACGCSGSDGGGSA